ncbi:MAG: hypothetical protein Q8K96_04410 [Rubrivivax sp.]|nr:hypothetical protein [Rubrivivax sp.]
MTLSALCLSSLLLAACDKERSQATVPLAEPVPVPVQAATTPSTAASTSVPTADSVLAPANETPKAGTEAGRSNAKMTRAEESSAMPMVGQNNDHSAPLAAAKRASAP